MELKNFIISAYRQLWKPEIKDLFISEPYVYHVLETSDSIRDFRNIEVAPFRRQSREDLIADSLYVDGKYEKYIEILTERLNDIHGLQHSSRFWRQALSMAFIRHITIFHDLFTRCETFFDQSKHTCNILSDESYYVPLDFEDHRNFFQNTDYGQEQIFSIYMKTFYPGRFQEVNQVFSEQENEVEKSSPEQTKARRLRKSLAAVRNAVRGPRSSNQESKKQAIEVGIVGSYFSEEHLNELINGSGGRIFPLDWKTQLAHKTEDISFEKRLRLARFEADFDKFDKFFFSTIPYCLPRAFVERYKEVEDIYVSKLNGYPGLRHIVSEGWISNTYMSIFLALAEERNITHIHNEHNCFFHPYAGSYISHVFNMCDCFVSLGWSDAKIPNLIRGASLFPFSVKSEQVKKYKILYVSAPANAKIPHYNSAWGIDEENAVKHLDFVKRFFGALGKETLQALTYRAYPKFPDIKLLSYNKESFLAPFLQHIKGFSGISEPSKLQMLQSELVVIDYVSTSYIEALTMNIPTVFFWNPDAYYLNDEYPDFFKALVDVGICQTDPAEAAKFIERIKDNPGEWWAGANVQAARNEFFSLNLGRPELMIDYLLGLIEPDIATA